MAALTSFPVLVLVIGCIAITVATAFAGRVTLRVVVPADEYEHATRIAGPLMPALGAVFGILMALTLASESGYLKIAQDTVADEAAAASRLAWAAESPGVDSDAIHIAMGDYLAATRADEWRGDAAALGASSVATSLRTLERVVRSEAARADVGTPVSTELLAALDSMAMSRRHRIAAAARQIPVLYIVTLLASGVALIVNAAGLGLLSRVRTSVLVVGLAVVVGLSFSLLLALSAPWRGPLIVSGQPIDVVINDLRIGFFGS